MSSEIPDELSTAKLTIEAASTALRALFERIEAAPRHEKIMANDSLLEAMAQLRSAQAALAEVEVALAARTPT